MITESRAAIQSRYVILKELPSGLLGPAMLVKRKESQEFLVCKVCHKSSIGSPPKVQSFKDRIQKLNEVNLPFVITYKDLIENDRDIFLFRDYIDAESLTDYVESSPSIPDPQILQIWQVLISHFMDLHKNGIFPSSIRPNNIFLRQDRELILTDLYELSSEVEWALQTPDAMHLTFLAPEFFDDGVEPGAKADVWSLGVVLVYMKFRVFPWSTKNIFSMIKSITDKNFRLKMDSDNDVEAVIMATVVRDVANRLDLEHCTDVQLAKTKVGKSRRGSLPGRRANKLRQGGGQMLHSGSMFCRNHLFLSELNSNATRSSTFDRSVMPAYTVRCRFLEKDVTEATSD